MIRVSLLERLLSRPNIMSLLIFAADSSLVDYRRLKTMARQRAEFWFSAITFLLLWNSIFLTIQQFPIVLWDYRSYIWTTTVAQLDCLFVKYFVELMIPREVLAEQWQKCLPYICQHTGIVGWIKPYHIPLSVSSFMFWLAVKFDALFEAAFTECSIILSFSLALLNSI